MKTRKFDLQVTFTMPVLGSQPTIAVASEFIAARAGLLELPEDEARTLPEELERGTTVFHRLNGAACLFDYQVKGFLKNAAQVLNGKVIGGTKNLKSKVNNTVFVTPRCILLVVPDGGAIEYLERPLRAETAQGPRIALARSEMIPAGSGFICRVEIWPGDITGDTLTDLLDYGRVMGIGQWRNGSYGQFEYTLSEATA
jgi:hypothetical protein